VTSNISRRSLEKKWPMAVAASKSRDFALSGCNGSNF